MHIPTPRRLVRVTDDQISQLADVLIDGVEGGASVSFMLPLTSTHALWPQGGPCATTCFYREVAA